MKIIAKTSDEGYLLEANKDEIALLMGFSSKWDDGMKNISVSVGLEMNITKMATTSSFIRNIDKDKLQKVKQKLIDTIDELDHAVETIQAVTIFETLKEDVQ